MPDFDEGWDCSATLVDGCWVDRRPRRPEVADQLRREATLLPWLAPRVPLRIPIPWVRSEDPLVLRHEFVPGRPIEDPDSAQAVQFAAFLRALHDVPVAEAVQHGLAPSAAKALLREQDSLFRDQVLPLLPPECQDRGRALLDQARGLVAADTMIHGDIGPAHLLVEDGTLTGVIDFGDARAGDAALDLAWALHGAPKLFADGVSAEYGVTEELRVRALTWHQLGPWYEVAHGLVIGDAPLVRTGLHGAIVRLRSWSGQPQRPVT